MCGWIGASRFSEQTGELTFNILTHYSTDFVNHSLPEHLLGIRVVDTTDCFLKSV